MEQLYEEQHLNTMSPSEILLHDGVSGKVLSGAGGGAPWYLNDEDEEEIDGWRTVAPSDGWFKQ